MSNYYRVNYCIVCKVVNDKVSYHTFPKDVNIREKWLKILNLTAEDIHSRSIICSQHFHISCYSKTALSSPRLMPGSLPNQQPYDLCKCNDFMDSSVLSDTEEFIIPNISAIEEVFTTVSMSDLITESAVMSISAVHSSKEKEEIKMLKRKAKTKRSSSPKRVRYEGDLIPGQHFSSPGVRKNVNSVRSRLIPKDCKIKTLEHTNRRLQKKITSLEDILKNL